MSTKGGCCAQVTRGRSGAASRDRAPRVRDARRDRVLAWSTRHAPRRGARRRAMSRLPLLTPDALDPAQRALYDSIVQGPRAAGRPAGALTDASGALVGPFNAFLY